MKLGVALILIVGLGWAALRWADEPVARPDLEFSPESDSESLQKQPRDQVIDPASAEPTTILSEEPLESAVVNVGGIDATSGEDSNEPLVEPVGHLSIVIDDLGRSVETIDRLGKLGVPLSYAVLPFETRTSEVVQRLSESRREILCHLPMQASKGNNPGPGALILGMTPRQLARATREAVSRVPGAVGVNNHMGSGLTQDESSMVAILEVLRDEELFFLDSRTIADTVGFDVARSLGIATAERQVFLDTDPGIEAVRFQFARLRQLAAEKGAAIAIGHPYPSTLQVLEEEIPISLSRGFNFVPVSFLLERTGLR